MSRELFGLILLIVQTSINIPIIIKLLKAKTGNGISLTGELIWVAGGIGWIIYGYLAGSVTLMISGSLAAVGCLLVSSLVWKYSRPLIMIPASFAFVILILILLSWLFGGAVWVGISLAIFGIVQFLPQLVLTVNNMRTRTIPTGVSVSGSTFRVFYTGGWAIYAGAWILWSITFEDIDWPLLIWGIAGVITFGLQAGYSWVAQKRLQK